MSAQAVVTVATLLMAAVGRSRLYGPDHRLTLGTLDELLQALDPLLVEERQLRLAVTGDELFTDYGRMDTGRSIAALVQRLTEKGVGLLEIHRGIRREELASFCTQLADAGATTIASQAHLLVGAAELKAGGSVTDAVRAHGSRFPSDEGLTDEALHMQALEGHVRSHRQVRLRDAREIVLGLLAHLAHQENVFINLAEVHNRHRRTYLHSCNVATLSMSFALALGMGGEEAYELGAAALLHDIGKSLVPVEILDKDGPLDEAEWEIMRRHPVAGARLLSRQRDVPRLAVVVAYEHHMDYAGGGGYPNASFAPSLQSQLVAIVDGFDAIGGRRSYLAPQNVLAALELLRRERGRRYAPGLLDSFGEFVQRQLAATARIAAE